MICAAGSLVDRMTPLPWYHGTRRDPREPHPSSNLTFTFIEVRDEHVCMSLTMPLSEEASRLQLIKPHDSYFLLPAIFPLLSTSKLPTEVSRPRKPVQFTIR
ncbi:hypothetical protein PMIN02_009669 [Paraphaeosphaeria minitans]